MSIKSILSISQYSEKQLQDKKFLKNQIAKYASKIKESKENTQSLQHVQGIYKGLLKEDPFYIKHYRDRKPVENPCRLCEQETYGGDSICFRCEKKASRKDKAIYQLTLICSSCGKSLYPKRFAIPYSEKDHIKCPSCKAKIIISSLDLNSQIKVEDQKYSYPKVTKIGEDEKS